MGNMYKYYIQLAQDTDNIDDKNMYEKQARKEQLRAVKARKKSLGIEAYKERRLREKERERAAQEAESAKNDEEESQMDDSDESRLEEDDNEKRTSNQGFLSIKPKLINTYIIQTWRK